MKKKEHVQCNADAVNKAFAPDTKMMFEDRRTTLGRDDTVLTALKSVWAFSDETLAMIHDHFGSFDECNYYIDIMDGRTDYDKSERERAIDAWPLYCIDNDIEHEIDSCPFIQDKECTR